MSRLSHVIVFTPDVERMRRFYQDRVGIAVAREGHGWVALRPAGAALWLHALGARHQPEIAFALHVEDLDATITALRAHGTDVTERANDAIFGRIGYFRDPEGNLVDLHAGTAAERAGPEPAFPALVLNVRNLPAAHAFYRDVVGLAPRIESPEWVDFETGPTRLSLHPRPRSHVRAGREVQHARPVTIGFSGPRDVVSWVRAFEKRGLEFAGQPRNEGFGTFALAVDPDRNVIIFRGAVEPPADAAEEGDGRSASPARPRPKPAAKAKPRARAAGSMSARTKATARKQRGAAKRRSASRKLKR